MSRVQNIFTAFTTGEISPKINSRIDFNKYINGVEKMENAIIFPQGGFTRRPGLRFVNESKDSTKASRMVKFQFSVTDAYILEFGENYIRFYRNQARIESGGSPVEVVTTYAEADLFDLHFAQSADVLYIAHKDYAPRKLIRASHISWSLAIIDFDPTPTFNADTDLSSELKPYTETVGSARIFIGMTGAELITNGDFDSDISSWVDQSVGTGAISFDTDHMELTEGGGAGGAGVDEAIAEQNVTLTAVSHTILFTVAVGALRLRIGSTSGAQDVLSDASYAVGEHTVDFTGNAGDNFIQFHNLTNALHELDKVSLVVNNDIFLAADAGRPITATAGGRGVIASIVNTHEITVDITIAFSSTAVIASGAWFLESSPNADCTPSAVGPLRTSITLTLASAGWRSADVGKFVKINNGVCKITSFTSTTVVKADVLSILDSTTAAVGGIWSLEDETWTSARGFPAAIGFYEQRLFYARTDTLPQTIWGSVIDQFESFATGTNDDDSLDFTITGQNPIRWLSPKKKLGMGTFGSEFTIGTTNDAAMSPTNIKIDDETSYGSSALQPVRVGEVTLFVQRSKRKLREFVFVFEDDAFNAPDLSLLAEHITLGGIEDIAYQQEPDSIVWMVRNDGQLLGMTYDRGQQIIGWHRQITGATGLFESVEAIPISDKDQTWVVVKRTINGSTVRNIEYFDEDAWVGATKFDQWNQLNTDSSLVYNSTATTTITGLSHLEGEEVAVVADGAVHPNRTVSSGSITLERSATEVEVGLAYTTDVDTVRPELQTDQGTIQGVIKGWASINARFLNTIGGTINGELVETRLPPDLMDNEPPVYTDDFEVTNLGYDKHARINIKQTQPYPLTVLSITGILDIGDI